MLIKRLKFNTIIGLPFIFVGLLFSACIKNNPDPSWIEVNKWSLVSNPNAQYPQGLLSENISDAFVFVDEKMIGIFEVPFKIPILKSGKSNIKIYPVVKNNGISATKKIYPFLEFYEINTELVQNKTLTINPVTRYYANTKFWIEDFEDAAVKIDNDPTSKVHIHSENDVRFLKFGNFYGKVTLNASDSLWIGYTTGKLTLPKGGKEVYLEIDYCNTNNVTTGLISISPNDVKNHTNIQLNRQKVENLQWKKMYIDLKELVSYSTSAQYFEISFESLFDVDAGLPSTEIYLDNIKLVYN